MQAKVILLKKTSGSQSFMIRLSHKGKKFQRTIKTPFTDKEWNYKKQQLIGVRPDSLDRYKQYMKNRTFVTDLESTYTEQINDLIRLNKPFSAQKVFDLIGNPNQEYKTVFEVFKARIKELKENSKFGTADVYQGTYNKFKKFCKTDMLFNELDDSVLLRFKKDMIKSGLIESSISIHLRQMRALYNYAIRKKIAFQNDYPFINSEIMQELKTGYKSRAITKGEIDKIRKYKKKVEEGSDVWHACNYFIFGYLGRGINFQDIARLTWQNRVQGRIVYKRFKTRSKIADFTSFVINPELDKILVWYRKDNTKLNNPYIFPILNESHIEEKTKYNRIKKIRTTVNSELKAIGKKINSEINLTTYVWRHSFAAISKNTLNVSISMISEMLGHKDEKTTKHYLKQFPDKDLDKAVVGL